MTVIAPMEPSQSSLKIEKLSYPLLPWILPLSCQASMVEFKLNWGQHLRDLIAHAGPACTVVDKFGENHQANNGKLVAIPTPDRFPLTVSVERAVLQASGGSEKLPLSDVTSDVPSPTSVATINTPSPKCQPINSFHRISKILWTDAGTMKFLVHHISVAGLTPALVTPEVSREACNLLKR